MVTHSSTSRPVQCLCMAERTGCPVLTDLWSYVFNMLGTYNINADDEPLSRSMHGSMRQENRSAACISYITKVARHKHPLL
jgi:hypothetical protein